MEILKATMDKLLKKGADKVQLVLRENQKQEFNVDADKFSLLRTNLTKTLSVRIIKNKSQGRVTLNKIDEASIDQAINDVLNLCEASPKDSGYDISTEKGNFNFSSGVSKSDPEAVYDFLDHYLQDVKKSFPKVKIETVAVSHDYSKTIACNSNGLQATLEDGQYSVANMFTAKDGGKTSSFNYVGFSANHLNQPLMDMVGTKELLAQSQSHLEARPVGQKFVGDIIVTPHAMSGFFVGSLFSHLADGRLIDDSSFFKGKLGQDVLSKKVSFQVVTKDERLASSHPMTSDGFIAKDYSLFKNGRLNHYLLSQYGANKTGLKQTYNDGGLVLMSAGDIELDQMIKNTKKGIVLARVSAGAPGANGDFSGVAKNSFYVENGKIQFPLKETMISGNIFTMFKSVNEVSQETINDGSSIYPWVKFTGVSVSG